MGGGGRGGGARSGPITPRLQQVELLIFSHRKAAYWCVGQEVEQEPVSVILSGSYKNGHPVHFGRHTSVK